MTDGTAPDEIGRRRFSRHQSRARHGARAPAHLRARAGDGLARRHGVAGGTDLVVIPGGFSYGDYLRCGAIAARAPIMDAVRAFAAKGGLVLAVCNGFQIACEAGLLPGVLMRNAQFASSAATSICASSAPTPHSPAATMPAR